LFFGLADCKATAVGKTMGAAFRGKNAKHQILISALPMHPHAEVPVIQLHDVDLKLLRVFATIVRCGGFRPRRRR
jgi:hypothetical protein